MECPKCSLPVNCKDDVYTVCEGTCVRAFHAECVGLSEASVNCLKKNIIWLCDECLAVFYEQWKLKSPVVPSRITNSGSSKTDPDLAEELTDIKGKIANIMETLSAISETQKQSIQCTPCHSTPINSPKLHEGSSGANHDNSHSAIEHSSSSAASSRNSRNSDGTFSLFLTNIDSHVNEEEINIMVSRSLGVQENEAIYVKKLVPKWKANDTLDYISFKVLIDDKFKRTALRADTWPAGITYREFVERPRNTWKPTG